MLTVFFLASWHDYSSRMDRFYYEYFEGLLALLAPGARADDPLAQSLRAVDIFGPGFHGWQETRTVTENLMARLHCCPSMIVVGSRDDDSSNSKLVASLGNASLVPPQCTGRTELMQFASDCHLSRAECAAQFKLKGTTIISLFHPQIAFEALYPPPANTLVAHLPFCVHEEPLAASLRSSLADVSYNMAERSGSLVVGSQTRALYPLHSKLAKLVHRGLLPGGRVNPHPTYELAGSKQLVTDAQASWCSYDPEQPGWSMCRRLRPS